MKFKFWIIYIILFKLFLQNQIGNHFLESFMPQFPNRQRNWIIGMAAAAAWGTLLLQIKIFCCITRIKKITSLSTYKKGVGGGEPVQYRFHI